MINTAHDLNRAVSQTQRSLTMSLLIRFIQGAGLTRESYEETVRKLSDGKGVHSPEDWPVEGLLTHIAGEAQGGFRVVDVWDSEDAARQFGDKLGPILQEVGIEAPPEIYPAHTFVTA